MIVSDARFGSLPVQAIVDTGGQSSIANVALGEALRRRIRQGDCRASEIIDVTLDVKRGDLVSTPPYESGSTTPTVPPSMGRRAGAASSAPSAQKRYVPLRTKVRGRLIRAKL
jgi:hypothetical protein